ncbi:MAG: hypothetical protein ACOX24_05965 [Christensenellales bacterium]|jgi:NRPS condensation-like uncharacterized protein|nr:hypothetical protein [Clostridiales bacterium]
MKKKMPKITKWFRLDRSADIYPMSTTRTIQSNFMISAELTDYIDEEVLAKAVDKALDRYPSFRVQLRRGVFRYYLERNNSTPKIWHDNGIEFEPIDFLSNRRFLFRIKVHKKTMSMDFFHGLADATGAIEFLKTIIYTYYDMLGEDLGEPIDIKRAEDPVDKSEYADDVHKYYKKFKLNDPVVKRMIGKNCYGIKDKKFKAPGYALTEVKMDAKHVLDVARSHDCTVTELLAGIILLGINSVYKNPKNKTLVAMIPVDLRRHFVSNTMHNFTTMVRCPINPKEVNADISSYANAIKENLRAATSNTKALQAQLSLSALLSKNPLTKIFPLALKTLFVKLPKFLSIGTKQTIIITNLGLKKAPPVLYEKVEKIAVHPNVSNKVPINVGIISFGNALTINFTRKLVDAKLELAVLNMLKELGIDTYVYANTRAEKIYKRRHLKQNKKKKAKKLDEK